MGLSNFRAPELTPEQKRVAEMAAQGLRRSSWDGRDERIPEPGQQKTEEELAAGWAAIRAQAAANTAQREAQEAAARAELHNLWAASEAQKSAAWERYVTLAGRELGGGLLANRALFDETWQRHLAQRAILESAGPGPG